MELFLSALLILSMRVVDVSVGALRIVHLVRGRRSVAGALGFIESLVWVLAARQVLNPEAFITVEDSRVDPRP